MRRAGHKQRGFTLVEMMVTLLVLGVLLAIGAPGFSELIKNNRMLSETYGLRAALNTARSEALAQRTFVTLCRSDDGASCSGDWNDGYIAFRDVDGDGTIDDPNDPAGDQIFLAKVLDLDSVEITYSNGANRVRFDSQGYATNFNGTIELCDDRGADDARGVIVSPGGIVRAAVPDPNNPDGRVLDHLGAELDCI